MSGVTLGLASGERRTHVLDVTLVPASSVRRNCAWYEVKLLSIIIVGVPGWVPDL